MRLVLLATVIMVLVQNGCRSTTSPDDLVVTATVAPPVFRAGTEVIVTVIATNHGRRPRTIETNPCRYRFAVSTPTGEVVGPGAQTCFPISTPRELAPGEQFVFTHQWAGDGRGETTEANILLAPGTYFLRGSVAAGESEPVTITIVP